MNQIQPTTTTAAPTTANNTNSELDQKEYDEIMKNSTQTICFFTQKGPYLVRSFDALVKASNEVIAQQYQSLLAKQKKAFAFYCKKRSIQLDVFKDIAHTPEAQPIQSVPIKKRAREDDVLPASKKQRLMPNPVVETPSSNISIQPQIVVPKPRVVPPTKSAMVPILPMQKPMADTQVAQNPTDSSAQHVRPLAKQTKEQELEIKLAELENKYKKEREECASMQKSMCNAMEMIDNLFTKWSEENQKNSKLTAKLEEYAKKDKQFKQLDAIQNAHAHEIEILTAKLDLAATEMQRQKEDHENEKKSVMAMNVDLNARFKESKRQQTITSIYFTKALCMIETLEGSHKSAHEIRKECDKYIDDPNFCPSI